MKFILTLLTIFITLASNAFELEKDGKISCSIVCTVDASKSEKYAAKELQKYLKKITGTSPKILSAMPDETTNNLIIIGTTKEVKKAFQDVNFDKLPVDTIFMRSSGNRLYIAGDRPRGTLYAVYNFLEDQLGCEFFTPDFELIPQKNNINIKDLNILYSPSLEYRQIYGENTHKHRNFAAKLKLNGTIWSKPFSSALGKGYYIDIRHSITNDFLNHKKLFSKHPEWFALDKKTKKRRNNNTQICSTNQAALEQLANEVLDYLKNNPDKRDFISISMADNPNLCECEKCQAVVRKQKAKSSLAIIPANYVAKRIAADYSETKVVMMTYWKWKKAPETMKLEPNVAIIYASLDRNHNIPVRKIDSLNRDMKKWQLLSGKQLYVWDYYASFGNFLVPYPSFMNAGDNFRFYKSLGVKGAFVQIGFGSLAQSHDLRTWLLGKLMWNPDLNEKKLIAKFLKFNYGAAAPYLSEYFYICKSRASKSRHCISNSTYRWLPQKYVFQLDQLIQKALDSVKKDPDALKRLRKLTASMLMIKLNRYDELKKAEMKLPPRSVLIDQLEALGKEYHCGTYKEWDSFPHLISKLRKGKK